MLERLRELLSRLVPSGSILQHTVKGGIWVSATNVSVRLLQVLMLVVLARLLSPRDFGLVGIALLALSGVRRFTQIGLNTALIQKREDDVDDYLDSTWVLQSGRGLLLFAVLFTAAPVVAGAFGESRATPLIRTLGLVPLIHGLRNPAVVYFRKDLAFHKEFVYKVSGGIAQVAVGIGVALYSPTVWALVFASLSRPAVRTALSYVLDPYRPRPTFDRAAAAELIDYGKWMTGASILGFIHSEGDDAFVGWFLSATSLGFYQYAYRMADMPGSELAGIVSQVSLSTFSKLQDDPDEFRRAFLKTIRFTAALAYPMAFGIALVAPSFVLVLLGEEWMPMVLTMQLLAFFGMAHASVSLFGEVWKALDRPDLITKLSAVRIICTAAVIWPATARWGIEGTALAITAVSVFVMVPLDVYATARLTTSTSAEIYWEFAYPLVAAASMFGLLWYLRSLLSLSPLGELLVLVPAGVVIYVAIAGLLELQFNWGMEEVLRSVARGMR